jgi:sugar phosphate isomerase/epimerase
MEIHDAEHIAVVGHCHGGHPEFGDAKMAVKGAVGTDGGEVNWKAVRGELAKVRFDGWATAEVAGGDRHRLGGIAAWMNLVLRRG